LIKLFYLAQTYSASFLEKEKKFPKVIEYAKEFLKINKEKDIFEKDNIFNKHIYVYLISSLFGLKQNEEAEKYIEEALTVDPLYPDFLFLKGRFLFEKEKYRESFKYYLKHIEALDRVKDINMISDYSKDIWKLIDKNLPDFPVISIEEKEETVKEVWKKTKGIYIGNLLANIYLKKEDKKKALQILKKLFFLTKDDETALRYVDLLKNYDIDKAINILKEIKKKNPQFIKADKSLGILLFEKGDYEKSLSYLLNYLNKSKDSQVLPLLNKVLILNGLEKEAYLLQKKIETLAKKKITLSDNQN